MNVTLAQLVGVKILKLVSSYFNGYVIATDSVVRYGDDEFLFRLPRSTSDFSKNILERLLKMHIENSEIYVKGIKISASSSSGMATHMHKNDFDTVKDFMAAADEALYKAKAGGKNCLSVY